MAFYVQTDADRFSSTDYTRGPWDARSQHAGPPAALLGRAVEAVARPGMRVARVTYDIARPVPVDVLEVTTAVVREGRNVVVVEAAVGAHMRCTAVLIRTESEIAPEVAAPATVTLDGAEPKPFFATPYEVGYHAAMEVRFTEGSFLEPGPATAWMRMRVPLVEGEEPSPLVRTLVAADSGNGISGAIDFHKYLFVNTDLTVHLVRYPVGEWVCLQSATSVDPAGIGLADTALHDERGRIGRSVQSLFVAQRFTS